MVKFCDISGIPYFRGSEDDVLDRYYQAAKYFRADVIVRITADCPLIDSTVIDKVVRVFQTGKYDYVSNTIQPTYPDGLDTEAFRFDTLEQTWHEASLKSEREHVTPYIWKHPNIFRLFNVKHEQDLSGLRWTVDVPEDLEFARRVFKYLSVDPRFGMEDVLALLRDHPELNQLNARFKRNQGYEKSLNEDRK